MSKIVMTILATMFPSLDIFFSFFFQTANTTKKNTSTYGAWEIIFVMSSTVVHTERVSNTCGGPNGMYAFTARRASHFPVKKLSAFAARWSKSCQFPPPPTQTAVVRNTIHSFNHLEIHFIMKKK